MPGDPTPKKHPSRPPLPLTPDPTKPAGATAQPAEAEPNPTGQAVSPCVYISHKAHRAGARPAAACNTNSEAGCHALHRPVHAGRAGGGTGNAPKKRENSREGGKPHPPRNRQKPYSPLKPTSAHPLARGSAGKHERQPYKRAATHPLLRGGQPPQRGETMGDAQGTDR